MADTPDDFIAVVNDFVSQTPERILAVFKASTQELVSNMQRDVPVDTGYCRSTIQVSRDSLPSMTTEKPKGVQGQIPPPTNWVVEIAQATLEDTIYVGWTANYAIFLEHGHSQKQAPSGFVAINVAQWPQIVEEQSSILQERLAMG